MIYSNATMSSTRCAEHPYALQRLEALLCSVVDYVVTEYESGEGLAAAADHLAEMGLTRDEMMFFGFPETE